MIATFPADLTLDQEGALIEELEFAVFSCDYNGWADVPEEEREGIDVFDTAKVPPTIRLLPAQSQHGSTPVVMIQRRRAA